MKTLTVNYQITDSPTPVAVLDKNLNFVNNSKIWTSAFNLDGKNIIGKHCYEILPQIPDELKKALEKCLQGETHINSGKKFLSPSGKIQWLKWKINPWLNECNEPAGIILVLEDFTRQKREDELLYRAEQVAKIGGWELDLINNEVYWTQITREIHEQPDDYIPNLEEGINYYKGKHRNRISNLVSRAMIDGTPWDTECEIITAKGNEIWVRTKGEADIIDGKCVRLFGTFQDIDAEKKAEIKLELLFKIATNNSEIGIWEYDLEKKTLVWDDQMYRLYGLNRADHPNVIDAWNLVLHPEDRHLADQVITDAVSGAINFDTEFRVIWPNGELRYIRTVAVCYKNEKGKVIEILGTNWDITELKTTQLMLEKSDESLQGTFENSNIGMVLTDLTGKLIKTNKSLRGILGYEEGELEQLNFKDITHIDDLKTSSTLFKKAIAGTLENFQLQKRYYHKKGHLVYALIAVTAVKDIYGEITNFIAQIVDISTQIKATNKLNRLNKIANKQNESLLNFAHIVSHNLRSHSTNLSMIYGFLNKENDVEEHANLMRMLGEASTSLNDTVFHLNEVIQVKTEAVDKLKKINICETLKSVQKNVMLLMEEKKAKCIVQIPENLHVLGISAYMDSIFLNLFTNSIKYSSPKRTPEIKIAIHKIHKDAVEIHFSDNGLGIDLKRHGDKIFGMYKTFHRNKDAKGIGLFLTKNQIEAMNGKIEIESEVDKGTLFKLFLEKA